MTQPDKRKKHPLARLLMDDENRTDHHVADAAKCIQLLDEIAEASMDDWNHWLIDRSCDWQDEVEAILREYNGK